MAKKDIALKMLNTFGEIEYVPVNNMKNIYLMSKETGELIPYTQAFAEFNSVPRKWFESVFDLYEETDIEVENSYLEPPKFY